MPRFQLVFRDAEGERSEFRYSSEPRAPSIEGQPLVAGSTIVTRGVLWTVTRGHDSGDIARYELHAVQAEVTPA